MKVLINGGCGFLGSNLSAYGIEHGYDVTVFDNLSRYGSGQNLEWLKTKGKFHFVHGDTRNKNDVDQVIENTKFDAVFHLAGQVAMTTSIIDPYKDFQTNAMGTLHMLDALRRYSPDTVMIFSSTNKVYGDLEQYTYEETDTRFVCKEFPNGFDESVPLDFCSPYGCSKGAGDQYMLDFHRIYGLKTIVFRHSSMYGERQFATNDQGWIGWFCAKAVEKKNNSNAEPFTISGNGKQVRDILHVEDMIRLYYSAYEHANNLAGNVYNIGGGMGQSLSLLELFDMLGEKLGVEMVYRKLPPRVSDQKVFVADIKKIQEDMDWCPQITANEGITRMIEWAGKI